MYLYLSVSMQILGFLGAGQMASALAGGFVKGGTVLPQQIVMSDSYPPALQTAAAKGYETANDNLEVCRKSDIIFLAVKPQVVDQVLAELSNAQGTLKPSVFVSICAGVPVDSLLTKGPYSRVIRLMPNTPCLVNHSATAMCASFDVSPGELDLLEALLKSVGIVHRLHEKQFDAVTGLSGSGPAYVYTMIEAMADAGVKRGLPRNVAQQLAAQTVMGSAKMVLEGSQHPAQLRDAVCSPGGTTICGQAVLEDKGFRSAVMGAVEASSAKSEELSGLFK
eukprot:GHVU01108915.1.p1 GENE.GHVU01108915.1~~GHVU01108915.1.p1  ORF type:complete len:279 (+),score=55.09 GHVU01108915.1:429-1265(+)